MEVSLQVPDDLVDKLQVRSKDLSRQAVESLAAASYRVGILTSAEVQRMLGLSTRWETDAFLKERKAYLHYTEEDLEEDIATFRRLSGR